MRILYQIRKDYLCNIAGDSIVLQNLRKNLMNLNVRVDVCTDNRINLKNYDLIHIFNTIRVGESYEFLKNAREKDKKVILTPIYWDLSNYFKITKQKEKLGYWEKNEKKRKYLFDHCYMYIPHCRGEAKLIVKNYQPSSKFYIAPYGVDTKFLMGEKHYLKSKYGLDDYILCVGRIHHQKNQLNLIRALSKEKVPLVFVGSINDKSYFKSCVKEGNKNILFLDKIKREELPSIYKSAKVHVLPSWIEYPGLASLEAGIAGCNVVTTDIGSTKEVFKEFVRYCKPHSCESIYEETMNAFESSKNNSLKDFIIENYTWMKSTEKLKEIYGKIIEG
ncbi:MAG: glycosyltransferase [Marinisporobacter sp.]|jgi:glycosyltransferase involved in cell wall biosynthesis|nr:glycosyltransferase [Marinisporobacter sp.]